MDKKQQAFEDWKKGMKYQEIADKYGISLSTVKSWAVRYWKKNETKKVATGEKKVATTTAKKLQLLENKGGAPKGNKNHLKHGIYEKILFEFLSQEEQELFLQQEIDEVEECKKMIRFCDLQILKFMRKIKELEQKSGGLVVSGVSKKKTITNGIERDATSDVTEEEVATNTVAVHELILKYNNEIEKAKKQKMKCLEMLSKFGESNKKNIISEDNFIEALKQEAGLLNWSDTDE